jgi:hypothetical protein
LSALVNDRQSAGFNREDNDDKALDTGGNEEEWLSEEEGQEERGIFVYCNCVTWSEEFLTRVAKLAEVGRCRQSAQPD